MPCRGLLGPGVSENNKNNDVGLQDKTCDGDGTRWHVIPSVGDRRTQDWFSASNRRELSCHARRDNHRSLCRALPIRGDPKLRCHSLAHAYQGLPGQGCQTWKRLTGPASLHDKLNRYLPVRQPLSLRQVKSVDTALAGQQPPKKAKLRHANGLIGIV